MSRYCRREIGCSLLALAILFITVPSAKAEQTVGLFVSDSTSYQGYTLFTPMNAFTAYLLDPYGRQVHSWDSNGLFPGLGNYFLPNGHLLWVDKVLGPPSESIHLIEFGWNGDIVWQWLSTSPEFEQHHDIEILPNGNILFVAREYIPLSQADSCGKDTTGFFGDVVYSPVIYEIRPIGTDSAEFVWEWHAWDHVIQDFDPSKSNYGVVADHPELIDANMGDDVSDWLHTNSVDYHPAFDQIVLSFRAISEIWIVDHSTTTEEAASHAGGNSGRGGDLLYRWGNPQNYRAGTPSDQKLSMQHDAHWIEPGLPGEGHLLIFDNGVAWGYSSLVEIEPPVDAQGNYTLPLPGQPFGPAQPVWTYGDAQTDGFFASFISGCQRLPNGNTLACVGTDGKFREVTPSGETVWEYVNPVGHLGSTVQGERPAGTIVFRCYRFGPDFPGLADKDLTPTSALEITEITAEETKHTPTDPQGVQSEVHITSNISSSSAITDCTVMVDSGAGYFPLPMLDDGQHGDGATGDGTYGATLPPVSDGKAIAYYLVVQNASSYVLNDPPNPPMTAYYLHIGYSCGNIDGSVTAGNPTDISDLTYLVDFLFNGGPPPIDLDAANVDGVSSGGLPVDISDLTYLVDFLFSGGPAPACQ